MPRCSSFVRGAHCSRWATKVEASAGQILIAPAGTPHKFENLGPGPLETIDIHENGSLVTDWLE